MKKTVLLTTFSLLVTVLFAQRTVTGRVTDEKGDPLQAVSVQVKGSSTGTSTKADGTYALSIPADAATLVFSSIGMEVLQVSIGSSNTINAQMVQVVQELAAAVVQVPYGTVKKTAFTGSESTIGARTLEKQQVTSVTKALEGLVPGVIATNGGGQPGSNANVRIRGIGSVNASSAPLYVLNGVPYDGLIASIAMEDIESVTVLKDAAAAALYGSRAANGVIMITTKSGKRGQPKMNLSLKQGFVSRGIPEYDMIRSKDYYEVAWESIRNALVYGPTNLSFAAAGQQASQTLTDGNHLGYNSYNVPGSQLVDPVTGKLNPNARLLWEDSWNDETYRTAPRTNINLNVSGAGDKNDYYISLGYLDEKGTVIESYYKRYNARINLNVNPVSWFKTGINLDGAFSQSEGYAEDGSANLNPFYFTRQIAPIYPVWERDAAGNFVIDPATGQPAYDYGRPEQMGTRPYAGGSNLIGLLKLNEQPTRLFNGNINTYGEILFLNGFSFKTTFGLNYGTGYNTYFQNPFVGDAAGVSGRSIKTSNRSTSYTLNEILSWTKSFGNHNLRVLAGHENYRLQFEQLSATRTGFPFPGTTELNTAVETEDAGSYQDNHRIESYLSSLSYDYDQKYLLSASFRRDGTSRFFSENRWGNFYSVGAGWRISQEPFLQNVKWLNELKLKVSYGEQGNEDILSGGASNYYAYQNLYYLGYNNASSPGALPAGLPNRDLVWETNSVLNIGADFSLFNNRLQGTVEFFNRKSDNLLFDVPLPVSTGNESITRNIGAMRNTGIELQLGYNLVRSANFDWRVDLNLTHFKNRVLRLPQEEIITGTKKLMEGRSIYDFWIREYAGVDVSTGEALFYKDVLDASGKPTGERTVTNNGAQASLYYKGSAIPDITGGITNSFRYREFELSFLLTFSAGGKFYDGNYAGLMHFGDYGSSWHTDILQRWQKPGDITNVPKVQNSITNQEPISTRFLFNGSYLNIKNVTLTYTLPSSVRNRLHLSGLQLFANVDNAWLFTAKKGMDPQRAFTGTSDFTYPPVRTVTVGLNVNL
ncbi:MAG: TonB-dependent receptor [Chitinophagaceae bacterium]